LTPASQHTRAYLYLLVMSVMRVISCKIYLREFLCMLDNSSQGTHITMF